MAPTPKRSAPGAAPVSFMQLMKKSFLEAMPIPESFRNQHCDGLLNKAVKLKGPSGSEFHVDVGTGGSFCKTGWKNFCKSNDVKDGDTLVFRVAGPSKMSCEVFSSDGCQKDQDTASAKKRPRQAADEDGNSERNADDLDAAVAAGVQAALSFPDQEQHFIFTNCELKLSVRKLGGTILQKPAPVPAPASVPSPADEAVVEKTPAKAATPKKVAKTTAKSPSPKKVAKTTAKSPSPASKASRPSTRNVTPRSAAATARALASPAVKKAETSPKRAAKKVKAEKKTPVVLKVLTKVLKKSSTAKAKVKKAVKAMVVADGKEGTPKSARKGAKVQTAAEMVTQARANACKLENPHVVLLMTKSNCSPYYLLTIPSAFAKQHLPQGVEELDMLDGSGSEKKWHVRWLGSSKTFSGGWCFFAQAHNICKGDACVLEVLSDPKQVKMHVFKASDDAESKDQTPGAAAGSDEVIYAESHVNHEVEALAVREAADGGDGGDLKSPDKEVEGSAEVAESPKRISTAAA